MDGECVDRPEVRAANVQEEPWLFPGRRCGTGSGNRWEDPEHERLSFGGYWFAAAVAVPRICWAWWSWGNCGSAAGHALRKVAYSVRAWAGLPASSSARA